MCDHIGNISSVSNHLYHIFAKRHVTGQPETISVKFTSHHDERSTLIHSIQCIYCTMCVWGKKKKVKLTGWILREWSVGAQIQHRTITVSRNIKMLLSYDAWINLFNESSLITRRGLLMVQIWKIKCVHSGDTIIGQSNPDDILRLLCSMTFVLLFY